jgi:hypothetical protein
MVYNDDFDVKKANIETNDDKWPEQKDITSQDKFGI